jgi:peptidoglycan L-alanyl-D-glutamate endopeptidase CwlK
MASRRLSDLNAETRHRAGIAQAEFACNDTGYELLIYCTYRSPIEQAKLYRQSRSTVEIDRKATMLTDRGFDFLAAILWGVGPQAGRLGSHVTKAGPGESWHQYKLAFDAVPVLGGKLLWDSRHLAWAMYGKALSVAKLEWAGTWKTFKEFPHAQLRDLKSNPLKQFEPEDVKKKIGL